MPDIINNVINGLFPASGHNIFVTEIAPYNNTARYFQQGRFFGGYRISKNLTGSRSHNWDLYILGNDFSTTNSFKPFFAKPYSTRDYSPLFCSSFTDNAGDNIYQPIKNFSGLNVLNHPTFSNYQYSGNFNFSPLLSTQINTQQNAELILYRASVLPLYPLLFCSSIPTHRSFGPTFISNFNISVDGTNSLGDVDISCSMVGGRSIISPTNIRIARPLMPDSYIRMKTIDSKNVIGESNNFVNKYRSINLSDCGYYLDLFTGPDALKNFVSSIRNLYLNKSVPPYKIVSMSLNISQNIDFTYTYPGYSVGQVLSEFTDIIGPRFASLSSRTVSGSIKLFSPQNYSFITANASSLTLYFGSYYFYSMKNVDWQQPVVTINPGNGFFIEYKFIARMNEFTAFNGFMNNSVSEFFL